MALGVELPQQPEPVGNYIGAVQARNLVFLSGHGPRRADGSMITGKVGVDLTVAEATEAARQVGLNMLSTLRNTVGDLDRVRRVVKVLGMVNAVAEFKEQPPSSMDFPISWSRSSVRMAGAPAPPSAWHRCRFRLPSKWK